MIIIGERINATRKAIARAIEKRDTAFLLREAQSQSEHGASYLDLNAGLGRGPGKEREDLAWMIETVQKVCPTPLCLDSSDAGVLEACLPLVKNPDRMINSITAEDGKTKELLPVIRKHPDAKVVALAMDDTGIPAGPEERVNVAERIIRQVTEAGVAEENIFVDCLVQPLSVDIRNGLVFLEALKMLKQRRPRVRTTCGLSNISYGLPQRRMINQYFLVLCIGAGLDSALVDPTEGRMREAACLAETVAGRDEYCMNYIQACRSDIFK